MNPIKCEGQSEPCNLVKKLPWVTDSDLDYPKMDSETVSPNSVKREDLELIDIDSLFDDDTDDKVGRA